MHLVRFEPVRNELVGGRGPVEWGQARLSEGDGSSLRAVVADVSRRRCLGGVTRTPLRRLHIAIAALL